MSLNIFIGYDPRQPIAFQVCAQSIWEHASRPVSITRLDLRTLPIKRRGLTEFTYSRFLVPYLSDFDGYSLFLDSDILVRCDIAELFDFADRQYDETDVCLVRSIRRFEWPSVMLFNNYQCKHLTPEFIESNTMYDFSWMTDPANLPKEYNHLVGYSEPNPDAKIVHFTKGVPVWEETKGCEFSKEWFKTFQRMNSTVSHDELMGGSVHVQKVTA